MNRTLHPSLILSLLGLASAASAQDVIVSLDFHGPSIGMLDGSGSAPIAPGDLLTPTLGGTPSLTPAVPMTIAMPNGPGGLGLVTGCTGVPAGVLCPGEVDALSLGMDRMFTPAGFLPGEVWFSTDAYVSGGPVISPPPNLATESVAGDAASDLWTNHLNMPPAPMPPFAVPGNHAAVVDGDGMAAATPFAYPGLGTFEPSPPVLAMASPGDTVDAAVVQPGGAITASMPVYFSLDAGWPDPLTGRPKTGSAPAHGFSPADVLVRTGAGPALFAPAPALGLDLLGGVKDDLDALILWENGNGVFDPSNTPYDWGFGMKDMLLFSVRRGSPVIGQMDSFMGIPIEEGDILTTPLAPALGGLSPFPAIFIAAENLGLGTVRSGTAAFGPFGDDLNALSAPMAPLNDCNGNGIEDAVDIATGLEPDLNLNGIPDSCEPSTLAVVEGCFCPNGAVCANPDPTAGCENGSGSGALLTASGSTSYTADDLVLTATNVAPVEFGLFFMGSTTIPPVFLSDGLRCAGGSIFRFPVQVSTVAGTASMGPGIIGWTIANLPPTGWITAGSTWTFQYWYRAPLSPCGSNANLTNSITATF